MSTSTISTLELLQKFPGREAARVFLEKSGGMKVRFEFRECGASYHEENRGGVR